MHHLEIFKSELVREVSDILAYWMRHSPDPVEGGFYGKIDNDNRVYPESPKGLALNSGILWTFSAAYNRSQNPKYLTMADRAYNYILAHFVDNNFGGVYSMVDYVGNPMDDRKHLYSQASCLYALSEYYKCVKKQPVLELAVQLFRYIEQHAFDSKRKGYYELFSREWNRLEDLSQTIEKTSNSHLHLLEAYTCLYTVWRNAGLRNQIEKLLEVFAHHIIDDRTHHMCLYFDGDWNNKSDLIAYGHDIAAAWLLLQAAETIRHPGWIVTMNSLSVKMAGAAVEGLDKDDGLNYELENGITCHRKHWWPQAEAMIGFYNAYEVSRDERYLSKAMKIWQFILRYIKDHKNGEWFWGIYENHELMKDEDKAGISKCPRHNARACLELIHRIAPEIVVRS